MSHHRSTYIPRVVYVTIAEKFQKVCIWRKWDKLNPQLKIQLVDQLVALRWQQQKSNKFVLVRKFSRGDSKVSAEINLETEEITLKGDFSKRVNSESSRAERKKGKLNLERFVQDSEIQLSNELNQAYDELKIEISKFDQFNLSLEWQSIVGEKPGDYLPALLHDSGWTEKTGEPGIFTKNAGANNSGCILIMDLNQLEAVIQISRKKTVYLKDEDERNLQLQKELFDEIDQKKDLALLEFNRLKQNVYREALMDFARSRGNVNVISGETGDEFHMVIEITQGVTA